MIKIIEVTTERQRQAFIRLPYTIHKHHPAWVPPLLVDEEKLLSPSKNPVFAHCTTTMLLAEKDGEIAGRAMGIIHRPYNQLHNQNWARFGFVDTIDDKTVFEALLDFIIAWAKKYGCTKLIGPFGFSDKDPQGFLSDGFDGPTVIVTSCNQPYVVEFTKQMGFTPSINLVQYKVPVNQGLLDKLKPYSDRAIRSGKIQIKEFSHSREVKPFVRDVFSLMNSTYRPIFGFSPITMMEADEFADRFLPILNLKLIKLVTDNYNQVIGFVIAMPDMADGLRKSRGKLFPFGWWQILQSMKKTKRLVLLLGAVDEHLRHKGLDAVLGYHLLKSAMEVGLTEMDSHLIMETNRKMRSEIERLQGMQMYKRYTIFERDI
jgi:GNAT superfamily N-acetyltransferase